MTDKRQLAWVSDLNLQPEVLGENALPRELKFYDTTLRDGEQTAGVCFSKEDKLEIARLVDSLGVDRIEAGMPVVSREDREAIEMIVADGLRAEIWGFCRSIKADIDACAAAGVKAIVTEIPTSPYKFRSYGMSPEAILAKLVDHLQYAKEKGLYTAFFAVDATRADPGFLREAYTRAVELGKADEVVLVDTLGVATPETMYYLTRQLRSWVQVPVHVHCHNDFGLGTACTVAGVKAGAQWAQTTINGIGEKTGNVDVAEVALVAETLYEVDTKIRFDRLYEVGRRVAEISGVPVSPMKPVIGENAFKRESGVAIMQIAEYPPSVEGYAPELINREREVLLGKKSGRHSIVYMLGKLNLSATEAQLGPILERVKELGLRNHGPVSEEQFRTIVAQVTGA